MTTPRSKVYSKYTLKHAYQEENMPGATTISNDVQTYNLRDDAYEVDIDVTLVTHENEEEEEAEHGGRKRRIW